MSITTVEYDGVPGVSYPGLRGEIGERGICSFFINDSSISGTWSAYVFFGGPSIDLICSQTTLDTCKKNDFIFYYNEKDEKIYLNQLVDIIDYNTMTYEEIISSMQSSMDGVEYDKLTATLNIINNIVSSYQQIQHIFISEYKDSWSNKDKNDISVIINTKNIEHEQYTGGVIENDESRYFAETENGSVELITFDVVSNDPNDPIGEIMIEAEFIKQNPLCRMDSVFPQLYNNNPKGRNSSEYPLGFPENINYEINFDNENLENFNVIVKNFNDGSNDAVYHSNIYIPKNDYSDYVIMLYVYTKISDISFKKDFLGQMSL